MGNTKKSMNSTLNFVQEENKEIRKCGIKKIKHKEIKPDGTSSSQMKHNKKRMNHAVLKFLLCS